MAREFTLPDVGEGVAEGELVSWLVDPGDSVSEDQPVAEVETDKALVELPSPVDGTVRELHVEAGEVVPVGTVLLTFDVEGETVTRSEDGTMEAGSDLDGADVDAGGGVPTDTTVDSPGDTSTDRVFAPPHVRRRAREAGIDLDRIVGTGPSGRITEADVDAALEDGVRETAAKGSLDAAGSDEAGESSSTIADTSSDQSVSPVANGDVEPTRVDRSVDGSTANRSVTNTVDATRSRTLATPATRNVARELGVDIDAVPAVEERDGEAYVTTEAVRDFASAATAAEGVSAHLTESADSAAGSSESGTLQKAGREAGIETTGAERREPITGVRRSVADAMVRSKRAAPHVTHHDEVDVTNLVEVRSTLAATAEERGITLTYTPFILKAVVAALQDHPGLNAVIDEAENEIVYRDYYHIGVATETEAGLMVPVIEDVDAKGLLQLASELVERTEQARDRTITPQKLQGSTFTVTNVGSIGGVYATPILNYPECGILAIGQIRRKPWVVTDDTGEESIEPRSVMPLSLSFDHRIVDGATVARFTNDVKSYLRTPERLLLK